MVSNDNLNQTFQALADPTRRAIIGSLLEGGEQRITDLAKPHAMSLAAVSKHIQKLEKANLVVRKRQGREFYLQLNEAPLREVKDLLSFYEKFWKQRFSNLESLLARNKLKAGARTGTKKSSRKDPNKI